MSDAIPRAYTRAQIREWFEGLQVSARPPRPGRAVVVVSPIPRPSYRVDRLSGADRFTVAELTEDAQTVARYL